MEEYIDEACYAHTGELLVDLGTCVYLKTVFPEYESSKVCTNENLEDIKDYALGILELTKSRIKTPAFNAEDIAKELVNEQSFTINVQRYSFDCFTICTLFRYLQEFPGIFKGYCTIRKAYPLERVTRPQAIILAHSFGFHGCYLGGHAILDYNRQQLQLKNKDKNFHLKIMTKGRESTHYKKANKDTMFASGHLDKTFEKAIDLDSPDCFGAKLQKVEHHLGFVKELIEDLNQP